jgi:hypothetical protein
VYAIYQLEICAKAGTYVPLFSVACLGPPSLYIACPAQPKFGNVQLQLCLCNCADAVILQDAVVKGWFRTNRQPTQGGTHLRCVALTAYEVASALAYIHSQGIMHLVRSSIQTLKRDCCHDSVLRACGVGLCYMRFAGRVLPLCKLLHGAAGCLGFSSSPAPTKWCLLCLVGSKAPPALLHVCAACVCC